MTSLRSPQKTSHHELLQVLQEIPKNHEKYTQGDKLDERISIDTTLLYDCMVYQLNKKLKNMLKKQRMEAMVIATKLLRLVFAPEAHNVKSLFSPLHLKRIGKLAISHFGIDVLQMARVVDEEKTMEIEKNATAAAHHVTRNGHPDTVHNEERQSRNDMVEEHVTTGKYKQGGRISHNREKNGNRAKTLAELADRHLLYLEAVQAPRGDINLMLNVYMEHHHGHVPLVFREDFCGTAFLSSEWVKSHPNRLAIGVDIDGPTLQWARENNMLHLSPMQRERMFLFEDNCISFNQSTKQLPASIVTSYLAENSEEDMDGEDVVAVPPADIICAYNYSVLLLHDRQDVVTYFRQVHGSLASNGVFVMDVFGGSAVQEDITIHKNLRSCKYEFEQTALNPVSGTVRCFINFKMNDRSSIRKAFSFHFRVYGVRELREMLREASFRSTQLYWTNSTSKVRRTRQHGRSEGTDDDNESEDDDDNDDDDDDDDGDTDQDEEENNDSRSMSFQLLSSKEEQQMTASKNWTALIVALK